MKSKNFPLRKEMRRARAQGRLPDLQKRNVRTKKDRSSRAKIGRAA